MRKTPQWHWQYAALAYQVRLRYCHPNRYIARNHGWWPSILTARLRVRFAGASSLVTASAETLLSVTAFYASVAHALALAVRHDICRDIFNRWFVLWRIIDGLSHCMSVGNRLLFSLLRLTGSPRKSLADVTISACWRCSKIDQFELGYVARLAGTLAADK